MERDVKERSLMSQSVHVTMLGSTIGERSQHGGGRVRKKVEWVGPGKAWGKAWRYKKNKTDRLESKGKRLKCIPVCHL